MKGIGPNVFFVVIFYAQGKSAQNGIGINYHEKMFICFSVFLRWPHSEIQKKI